jgi:hypothetical protein
MRAAYKPIIIINITFNIDYKCKRPVNKFMSTLSKPERDTNKLMSITNRPLCIINKLYSTTNKTISMINMPLRAVNISKSTGYIKMSMINKWMSCNNGRVRITNVKPS